MSESAKGTGRTYRWWEDLLGRYWPLGLSEVYRDVMPASRAGPAFTLSMTIRQNCSTPTWLGIPLRLGVTPHAGARPVLQTRHAGEGWGGARRQCHGPAIRAPRKADLAKWANYGVDAGSYTRVLADFQTDGKIPQRADDAYHGPYRSVVSAPTHDEELTLRLLGFVGLSVAHGFRRVFMDFNVPSRTGRGYPVGTLSTA